MLTAADIVRFDDAPPPEGEVPWLAGAPDPGITEIVPSDPEWAQHFEQLTAVIRSALGDRALDIEHVGSTSVPGLPAKPIIDIDLTVQDAADEKSWLPPLEQAGFVLKIREP